MPFFQLRRELAQSIATLLAHPEVTPEAIEKEFSTPPNISMGHVALPCFRLAKMVGKASHELTKSLTTTLTSESVIGIPAGPYANFKWKTDFLYSKTLEEISVKEARYGSDDCGKGKRVLIEYCSPNIAKKLAFHHIRSTLIGNSLANIYDYLGFECVRLNFVGDWGSQFARLLAAVELWGEPGRLTLSDVPGSMAHLSELYVKFHKELDSHPEWLEAASNSLKRLETGEKKATELWRLIREVSIAAMNATLERVGIRFDHVEGESHYISRIDRTLEEVKSSAHAKLSEGAWIVEVDGISTPALIQKRDGTTLYLTRDIAAAIDRSQRFPFDKMYYVVSEQQRLHFQLLFGVLKKMGYAWSEGCEHISFGTVLFGSEKMSTREGRVILLDEILNEAKALALVECTQKNPELADKESVAEMVGIGAIVFGELSAHRQRDIEFDWKQILSFDGETGPYVQYSLVRCRSLLGKAAAKGEAGSDTKIDTNGYEFSQEEESLILVLSKFRSSLRHCLSESEPFHLAHFLLDLAKAFNKFYYRYPVLQASDPSQRAIRLRLVGATEQVLAIGLKLMGIGCPKEM